MPLPRGRQFVGLAFLPAVTVNIMLGFTSVVGGAVGDWLAGGTAVPVAVVGNLCRHWRGAPLFLPH